MFRCVDKPTRCNTSYEWSLLSINWLYIFRTITSPSSAASSHKLYNALVCSCYQASLAVAWMYIHATDSLHIVGLSTQRLLNISGIMFFCISLKISNNSSLGNAKSSVVEGPFLLGYRAVSLGVGFLTLRKMECFLFKGLGVWDTVRHMDINAFDSSNVL